MEENQRNLRYEQEEQKGERILYILVHHRRVDRVPTLRDEKYLQQLWETAEEQGKFMKRFEKGMAFLDSLRA